MSRHHSAMSIRGGPVPVAAVGAGVMLAVIAWALIYGDFAVEGAALLRMPWGVVTLVDVYVGLALVSAWAVYRERSLLAAAAWIGAFVAAGNLATCCYVIKAAYDARGDRGRFWTGDRL